LITAKARRRKAAWLLCAFLSVWSVWLPAAPAGKTVWDGIYTEGQAERGQAAYTQYCVACHKADLMGIEDAMKGAAFMERRREDSLESLFLDMKATMPRRNPGGLPDQTYIDIISYLLKNNEMPPGSAELKPEMLEQVDLVGKEGPKPVPNFVPVLSVGCLVDNGEKKFTLINASEPVRTRDSFARIEKELKASQTRALGPNTFRLADADDFGPGDNVGKKVQVKGIIVRAPAGNRINVNSIERIADSCQ
jgi:mono/diheme cytochrome c family protein